MFAGWTVTKKISGLVALGFPPLLFLAVMSYNTTSKMVSTSGWVSHTHEVLEAKADVVSLLKDAETGQRGYLITGEAHYLEPYQKATANVGEALQHLRQLTADNPEQQRRIDEIEPLVAAKLAELKETIDLRSWQGFEAARAVVLTDPGKQVMDKLRGKLSELESAKRVLLRSRTDAAQAVGEVAQAAGQIASAASQVSGSSQGLAQSASEQAASLEETSAST